MLLRLPLLLGGKRLKGRRACLNRLGLGAKFISHRAAAKSMEETVMPKLLRERQRKRQREVEEAEEAEHGEHLF